MKPVNVKSWAYLDFDKKTNKRDPKFKVDDPERLSKYKNIFATAYVPNWSKEVFVITKVKNNLPWTYVISDLKGKEILKRFTKKNCKARIKYNLEKKK